MMISVDEDPNALLKPSKKDHLIWLRRWSKLLVVCTLVLIFAGGLVKSTESGLAVPDWPLSYGTFFPPMVGGVLYEHGHRMIATFVGLLTLIMAVWITFTAQATWLKVAGLTALGAVIVQGVLGGITVLFFLPDIISIFHGTLAQIFLCISCFIAYALSKERADRVQAFNEVYSPIALQWAVIFIVMVFTQLLLGALVRHTESGLAIYDFPTHAGEWIPNFSDAMVQRINDWRFNESFDFVSKSQVVIHFMHRAWAYLLCIVLSILSWICLREQISCKARQMVYVLITLVIVQVGLGISTVLLLKEVYVTTFHVLNGALVLACTFLLILRLSPAKLKR